MGNLLCAIFWSSHKFEGGRQITFQRKHQTQTKIQTFSHWQIIIESVEDKDFAVVYDSDHKYHKFYFTKMWYFFFLSFVFLELTFSMTFRKLNYFVWEIKLCLWMNFYFFRGHKFINNYSNRLFAECKVQILIASGFLHCYWLLTIVLISIGNNSTIRWFDMVRHEMICKKSTPKSMLHWRFINTCKFFLAIFFGNSN